MDPQNQSINDVTPPQQPAPQMPPSQPVVPTAPVAPQAVKLAPEKRVHKFSWGRLFATIGIVIIAMAAAGGSVWYVMDQQAKRDAENYQKQLNEVEAQKEEAVKEQDKIEENKPSVNTSNTVTTVLDDALLKNSSLIIEGKAVTLSNGVATSGINTYTLESQHNSYRADKMQAGLIIKRTAGGTGAFRYLVIVGLKGGKSTYISSVSLGDRVQINSLNYSSDSKITVSEVTFGPNDPSCCPSLSKVINYKLTSDSKLIEV